MQKFDLEDAISQSALVSDLFQKMLGTTARVNDRGRLTVAYVTLALDHREAILLLVEAGAYASATALQRPLLEACVSGAWIYDDASDDEVKAIAAMKRPPPKYETMSQRLRKSHALGEWFEVLRGHYNILGDYAHGHQRQISRWISQRAVGPKYSEDQMIETLRHSDIVGMMAAVYREKIANRPTDYLVHIIERAMQSRIYLALDTANATTQTNSASD